MSITAKDGTATIDLGQFLCFLGHTGGGQFPPTGIPCSQIVCRPKLNESQILVFGPNPHEPTRFCYIKWEGEKVIVDPFWRGKDAVNPFTITKVNGPLVGIGSLWYVSGHPEYGAATDKYRYVDIITLMRYIEGRIGPDELRYASCRNKLSARKKIAQDTRIRLLQKELCTIQGKISSATAERNAAQRNYAQEREVSAALHKIIRAVPRWIVLAFLAQRSVPNQYRAYAESLYD